MSYRGGEEEALVSLLVDWISPLFRLTVPNVPPPQCVVRT